MAPIFGDENGAPGRIPLRPKTVDVLERENRGLAAEVRALQGELGDQERRAREYLDNARSLAGELERHERAHEGLAEQVGRLRSVSSRLGGRLAALHDKREGALDGRPAPALEGPAASRPPQGASSRPSPPRFPGPESEEARLRETLRVTREALMQAETTAIVRTAHLDTERARRAKLEGVARALRHQRDLALVAVGEVRDGLGLPPPDVPADLAAELSALAVAAASAREGVEHRVAAARAAATAAARATLRAEMAEAADKRERPEEGAARRVAVTQLVSRGLLRAAGRDAVSALRAEAGRCEAAEEREASAAADAATSRAELDAARAELSRLGSVLAAATEQAVTRAAVATAEFAAAKDAAAAELAAAKDAAAAEFAAAKDEAASELAAARDAAAAKQGAAAAEAARLGRELRAAREAASAAARAGELRTERLEGELEALRTGHARLTARARELDEAALELENQLSAAELKLRELEGPREEAGKVLEALTAKRLTLERDLEARNRLIEDLARKLEEATAGRGRGGGPAYESPTSGAGRDLSRERPAPGERAQVRRLLREREALIRSLAQLQAALATRQA